MTYRHPGYAVGGVPREEYDVVEAGRIEALREVQRVREAADALAEALESIENRSAGWYAQVARDALAAYRRTTGDER